MSLSSHHPRNSHVFICVLYCLFHSLSSVIFLWLQHYHTHHSTSILSTIPHLYFCVWFSHISNKPSSYCFQFVKPRNCCTLGKRTWDFASVIMNIFLFLKFSCVKLYFLWPEYDCSVPLKSTITIPICLPFSTVLALLCSSYSTPLHYSFYNPLHLTTLYSDILASLRSYFLLYSVLPPFNPLALTVILSNFLVPLISDFPALINLIYLWSAQLLLLDYFSLWSELLAQIGLDRFITEQLYL